MFGARRALPSVLALMVASSLAACAGEPTTIRVAVIQTGGVEGDVDANLDHAERLVRDAAKQGAKWILLPELYALFPQARAHADAEAIRREADTAEEPTRRRMQALAEELSVNVGIGKPEHRGPFLFNTVMFFEPRRVAGTYDKRLLTTLGQADTHESVIFSPGNGSQAVLHWGGIRVGAMICADSGNDRLWEHIVKQGAQIVFWSSSSSRDGSPKAPTPEERARAEGIPVAFANRSRITDLFSAISGGSRIIAADGAVLAETHHEADAVVVADVPLRVP